MRVKITKPGIFGAKGEIPVGTEVTVKEEPKGWVGRYEVITGDGEGKTAITNPAQNERDELKKKADELGIEYAKNISNEKLQELIDAKLAE
nr:hypothetical protein [Brucella intermedia]